MPRCQTLPVNGTFGSKHRPAELWCHDMVFSYIVMFVIFFWNHLFIFLCIPALYILLCLPLLLLHMIILSVVCEALLIAHAKRSTLYSYGLINWVDKIMHLTLTCGRFDMLTDWHVELISTCYSVQPVRLPLRPQSSRPSAFSVYDNKHCSSGFLPSSYHTSLLHSLFIVVCACVCVCGREGEIIEIAALLQTASSIWMWSLVFLKETL